MEMVGNSETSVLTGPETGVNPGTTGERPPPVRHDHQSLHRHKSPGSEREPKVEERSRTYPVCGLASRMDSGVQQFNPDNAIQAGECGLDTGTTENNQISSNSHYYFKSKIPGQKLYKNP